MNPRPGSALATLLLLCSPALAAGQMSGHHMKMPMADKPAHFKPALSAYTAKHAFLVKLTGLPHPIPYQKYFTLRFAVFDGHHPDKRLARAKLKLFAGMRHGMKHGFAHGMQSAPKISDQRRRHYGRRHVFPHDGQVDAESHGERRRQAGCGLFRPPLLRQMTRWELSQAAPVGKRRA